MPQAIETIKGFIELLFDIADHLGVQHDTLSGLLTAEAVKRANAIADAAEDAKFGG
jgi:hypothetical protein